MLYILQVIAMLPYLKDMDVMTNMVQYNIRLISFTGMIPIAYYDTSHTIDSIV